MVLEDSDKKTKIIDQRVIVKDYVEKKPVVVKDIVDENTKT